MSKYFGRLIITVVFLILFMKGKITYAKDMPDEYLLASIIMDEAGYCDDTQQLYVGSVVLNRIADERFPDSLKEVIFAKGQYQTVQDGKFNIEVDERALKNARKLLKNGSILPKKVVYQSNQKIGKKYLVYEGVYYCY